MAQPNGFQKATNAIQPYLTIINVICIAAAGYFFSQLQAGLQDIQDLKQSNAVHIEQMRRIEEDRLRALRLWEQHERESRDGWRLLFELENRVAVLEGRK